MKAFFSLLMIVLVQGCVQNKTTHQDGKLESFQMSGNMGGYSCQMMSDKAPVKIFMDGVSFEHADSSMRFYLLDEENNIVDTSIKVNEMDLWEAMFETPSQNEPSIDSAGITFYESGAVTREKTIIVRHWPKQNGYTQIISINDIRSEESHIRSTTVEAEMRNCRPALLNESEHKITEI